MSWSYLFWLFKWSVGYWNLCLSFLNSVMYNLSDLETYIAVVENRGINAAAQMLKVSPATVSLRLSKLEQALSTVLVFRDSRKLKLSPEGEIFYQQVGTILEALRDAEFQIGARRSSVSGVLRVTMPP